MTRTTFRNARIIAQIAAAAFTIGASVPAVAQTPTYRAVPATPLTKTASVVVGETLWMCGPDGCTTANATSRASIVCEQAAKKVGKLASFAAGPVVFDEAALAKCNAKAKA